MNSAPSGGRLPKVLSKDGRMFAIIISEKGGAERKEQFDKNEINVGRVQGNDLMLPKGNVSKHHARLLYRDGRFIVTDLKSTNGTYVNGRKIAQATIVREGDKIYIGDFVLRLDTQGAQTLGSEGIEPALPPIAPHATSDSDMRSMGRTGPNPGAGAGATGPNAVLTSSASVERLQVERSSADRAPVERASAPMRADAGPPAYSPPDHDADDQEMGAEKVPPSLGPAPVRMPAPPRIPTAVSPASLGGPSPMRPPTTPLQVQPAPAPPRISPAAASPLTPAAPPLAPTASRASAPPPQPRGARESSGRESVARENNHTNAAGKRLSLVTLMDRVARATDLTPLRQSLILDEGVSQRLERVAREQAMGMQNEGDLAEGGDVEGLVRDALRELVALGPIGPLLDDDDVTEITCLRQDNVLATRNGAVVAAEASFTSEEALSRVIARLAYHAGEPARPGEAIIERRLSRGAHMLALVPPAAASHALIIRKRRRLETSLEDYVRLGGLSRAMATFLDNCLTARANILVCGSSPQAVTSFLSALAASSPAGERVAVLQQVEELVLPQAHVLSLALPDSRARGEEAVRVASKIRPDRTVVSGMAGNVAAAMLEAISEGSEGVLATTLAPSMRQGLSRVVAQVLLTRPGMSVEAARECLGESFDVVIEVAPLADGRHRVVRIAELGGTDGKGIVARDIFLATGEGDGSSFAATGVVPRVVGEFAQRGVKVDPNLFKRSVGARA